MLEVTAIAAWTLCTAGCARILGADEFRVSESGDARAPKSEPVDPCGLLEARDESGGCSRVGVDDCGHGFELDGAGCRPIAPAEPCSFGKLAIPGSLDCAAPTSRCQDGPAISERDWIYVREDAPPGGSGSSDDPVRTIAEALDVAGAAEPGETTWVYLYEGEYVAPEVVRRRLGLRAPCARKVLLTREEENEPVMTFGAGSGGSSLGRVEITGPGNGILVRDTSGICLRELHVHDVSRFGIRFEEAAGMVSNRTLVETVSGAGIDVHGAPGTVERHESLCLETESETDRSPDVTIRRTNVRDVSRPSSTVPGRGIAAYPSPLIPDNRASGEPWDPALAHRPRVAVAESLVESVEGIGLLAEGADLDVTESAVRDIRPDDAGRGRGLVVRRRLLGALQASLDVTRATIEDSHDVAARVKNAEARFENVTIRGVGDTDGACLGNGIRARFDRPLGPEEEPMEAQYALTVDKTAIEGTRESAVHVLGGRASVRDSLIRGVEPDRCRGAAGDGIATYDLHWRPATVDVRHLRVDQAARAAIARFPRPSPPDRADASVGSRRPVPRRIPSAVHGVDAACSQEGLVGLDGSDDVSSTACGCDDVWTRCSSRGGAPEPAVRGLDGCSDGETPCASFCDRSFSNPASPVADGAYWVHGRDDWAPALTDGEGCVELAAPERVVALGFAHDQYMPAQGLFHVGSGASGPLKWPLRSESGLASALAGWVADEPAATSHLDLRRSPLLGVFVCRERSVPWGESPGSSPCEGIPGLRVRLEPDAAVSPTYDPLSSTQGASSSSDDWFAAAFMNLEPGEYAVSLEPPAGKKLDCSNDLGGGVGLGGPITGSNALRFRAYPAVIGGVVFVCSVSET